MPLSFQRFPLRLERATGVEPATSSLGSWHSTTELRPLSRKTLTEPSRHRQGPPSPRAVHAPAGQQLIAAAGTRGERPQVSWPGLTRPSTWMPGSRPGARTEEPHPAPIKRRRPPERGERQLYRLRSFAALFPAPCGRTLGRGLIGQSPSCSLLVWIYAGQTNAAYRAIPERQAEGP